MDVHVDSIAAGGDGVARAGGLVVFLPRTAPGDRGRASVALQPGGRFARGTITELTAPGPGRVDPPCVHYTRDRCGGCQLQHLAYPAQLEAKRGIVRDALGRIGGRDVEPPAIVPSVAEWRYRRKLTLAMRRRGRAWIAGLHPYDAPGDVFALADCPITDERVLAVWREIMAASAHLPHDVPALRGAVRLMDDGSAIFLLEGGRRWERAAHAAFFTAVPSLAALWWEPDRSAPGTGRTLLHERRSDVAHGASFVQVNPGVAVALREHVITRALAHHPRRVIDAYAGSGETAVRLAREAIAVVAIELDRHASARSAALLPPGSEKVTARVEDVLGRYLPADLVILNPPRTGLDAGVTTTLHAAAPPPRALLYVSCNPATLARDLARLPAYRLASVVSFDMFPQTAHVETVCELVPHAAGSAA